MDQPTSGAANSSTKNIIAIVLMVVVVGGAGAYIFNKYRQQQAEQSKLDSLVNEDVDPEEIRAARRRTQQAADTARKFAPLLQSRRNAEENKEAAGEAAPAENKLPFAVPSAKPAEGEAAPAEGEGAEAESVPAEGEAPPAN